MSTPALEDKEIKHCDGKPNCIEELKKIHDHFKEGDGLRNVLINFGIFIFFTILCVLYQYWY